MFFFFFFTKSEMLTAHLVKTRGAYCDWDSVSHNKIHTRLRGFYFHVGAIKRSVLCRTKTQMNIKMRC